MSEVIDRMRAYASQLGAEIPPLFVIAFRSKLKPHIRANPENIAALMNADKLSHAEATQLGGLLKYWYGEPDQLGNNLATCWWRSAEDARAGGTGPAHRASVSRTKNWYALWQVEQYQLVVKNEVWSLERITWNTAA